MPDERATRKRQIWLGQISPNYLNAKELRQEPGPVGIEQPSLDRSNGTVPAGDTYRPM